ncbi:class I SAM-dependent methyltransferase [Ectothiorhodospiraceae bacterium BW-2]|nr:class I SAM-dependent methyltransferase [Ectothiorhodospiraceae bacterium BW-2]
MLVPMSQLPQPSGDELALSQPLQRQLVAEMNASAVGAISFERFMTQALYQPRYGYYCRPTELFGVAGDFITAPELTPLFGQSLANALLPQLEQWGEQTRLIEFGAGSGKLAAALLQRLAQLDRLPERYIIVELSAARQQQQQQRLQQQLPELFSRIEWWHTLPSQQALTAIVIANEVIDAIPFNCYCQSESGLHELGVGWRDGAFYWAEMALESSRMPPPSWPIPASVDLRFEFGRQHSAWLATVAEALKEGAIWLLDYGVTMADYFERPEGRLRGYYRHHLLDNPLLWPGLVDLTCDVNFTALADSALALGLAVRSFTTQSQWLLGAGLLSLAEGQLSGGTLSDTDAIKLTQQLQWLTDPADMGDKFKLLLLEKGRSTLDYPWRDLRYRL